jgi:hypothetical protein
LLSIFCRLSACSADLRGFQSPGTACFILGGNYSLFPRVRLLQKIRSLAQSLPQILDPSLRFVDPLKFLIPLKDFSLILWIVFPKTSSLPHVSSIFSWTWIICWSLPCWREPISFLKSARAKDTGRYNYTYTTIK